MNYRIYIQKCLIKNPLTKKEVNQIGLGKKALLWDTLGEMTLLSDLLLDSLLIQHIHYVILSPLNVDPNKAENEFKP